MEFCARIGLSDTSPAREVFELSSIMHNLVLYVKNFCREIYFISHLFQWRFDIRSHKGYDTARQKGGVASIPTDLLTLQFRMSAHRSRVQNSIFAHL